MSGTSALRIGAEFLTSLMGKTIYYYSDPTWGEFYQNPYDPITHHNCHIKCDILIIVLTELFKMEAS